jgi:hypothetical protein
MMGSSRCVCLGAALAVALGLSISADAADWKHVPDPWRDGDRAHDDPAKKRPLVIKEQGSFFVGGEPFFTETGNDTDIEGDRNPGTVTIDQSYVEFQIPGRRTPRTR